MLEPGFASLFEQIFRVLATRTTKERVENETQVGAIWLSGPKEAAPLTSITML